jgi:hypothetical protein
MLRGDRRFGADSEKMSSEFSNNAKDRWPWPDALDALVAAPDHHTLVFENDRVRVVRTRIPPGQTVPVHTHRWPFVLCISKWSDLVRRDPQANILMDTRALEKPSLHAATWQESLTPHSVENVGDTEFDALNVEIKDID